MGTRELLILILGLAVIAVILRGLYVALNARRSQIRLSIDNNIPQDIDLEELEMSELPSGGARVVRRTARSVNQQNTMQNELDLDPRRGKDQAVPMLLDPVEIRHGEETGSQGAEDTARASVRADDLASSDASAHFPGSKKEDVVTDAIDDETGDTEDIAAVAQADDEASARPRVKKRQALETDWEEVAADREDEFDGEAHAEAGTVESRDNADDQEHFEAVFGTMDDNGRQEPALNFDESLEEELDGFSLSAGDRIGTPEADDGDDPLFSQPRRGESPGVAESRSVDQSAGDDLEIPDPGEPEPETADDQTREDVRDTHAGNRQAEPEDRDTEGGDIADLNQARESRRPAGGAGRTQVSRPAPRREVEPSEVLVVNVMSREGELFSGAELLQVMITAGLKHGEMNIFHKHLDNDVHSPVVFSVANILNPGTFDLDNMDAMATRGVSLFLAMPAVISNRDAFEDMLRTAQQIRAALDGELRDDHRSVMTAQTVEHYRQRIQDYELRRLKAAQAQS